MQEAAKQELAQAGTQHNSHSEQQQMELRQVQQQLSDAQRACNTAELEADSLRG